MSGIVLEATKAERIGNLLPFWRGISIPLQGTDDRGLRNLNDRFAVDCSVDIIATIAIVRIQSTV